MTGNSALSSALYSDELFNASHDLPALPPVIRYEDDYAEKIRSINTVDVDQWEIAADGTRTIINWSEFPSDAAPFFQCWLAWHLSKYDATSSLYRSRGLVTNREQLSSFLGGLLQDPHHSSSFWKTVVVPTARISTVIELLKSMLRFFCNQSIGPWTPAHTDMVGQWHWGVRRDHRRTVRTGEAILSSDEERNLVIYFEELNRDLTEVSDAELRAACVLYWSFQHGFRTIQIAALNIDDTRVRKVSNGYSVHVKFFAAKQRVGHKRIPMLRKVKSDWTPMMVEYVRRRAERPTDFLEEPDRPNSLFGLPPQGIQILIKATTLKVSKTERSQTDLRHTAAQRLVDSGASEIELAEFLGHSDITSGLVYFEASPTQADRVNKALGLSPIFGEIDSFIAKQAISSSDLAGLPPDKQIGAAPHGVSIAGIGGCAQGQSLCAKNPALSCYTCPKFMPLRDVQVHRDVANQFREVVRSFSDAAKGDAASPPFMQLRRTLEAVDEFIIAIESTR